MTLLSSCKKVSVGAVGAEKTKVIRENNARRRARVLSRLRCLCGFAPTLLCSRSLGIPTRLLSHHGRALTTVMGRE